MMNGVFDESETTVVVETQKQKTKYADQWSLLAMSDRYSAATRAAAESHIIKAAGKEYEINTIKFHDQFLHCFLLLRH